RFGGLPRRRSAGHPPPARRRLIRGPVSATGRGDAPHLGGRRRRSPAAARARLALSDPIEEFGRWLEEARAAGVDVPEAMTLATADASGRPSARMLLLKGVDERGFTFFTG